MPSNLIKSFLLLAPLVAAVPAKFPRQATAMSVPSPSGTASPAAQPTLIETASDGNSSSSSTATTQATSGLTDMDILQFALTAEHLESTFYKMGLQKFQQSDFTAAGADPSTAQMLMDIGTTEATHVDVLTQTIMKLGGTPVQQCDYDFSAALASPQAMLQTARVLEAVGVSAYLGAARFINSSDVLDAAASIVTVESRHQSVLRLANKAVPVPAPFDVKLSPRAVFTLASPFIKSCPQGSNLSIQPFAPIALQNAGAAKIGSSLKLQTPPQSSGTLYCAFVAPGSTQYQAVQNDQCNVPDGLAGEVYMMVTEGQSIDDSTIRFGPAVIQPS